MKYNLICWEITKKSMQFIQAWPGYVYTNFTDWARFVTLKKKRFLLKKSGLLFGEEHFIGRKKCYFVH